jgi:hypothetical protein
MTAQRKKKLQTYHATVLVTRAEEWCVDATNVKEAQELFEAGQGHRCSGGDAMHVELSHLHKDIAV